MVAQDVGSAIRGPERGDIFWGSGEAAGAIAGTTAGRRLSSYCYRNIKPLRAMLGRMGKRGRNTITISSFGRGSSRAPGR